MTIDLVLAAHAQKKGRLPAPPKGSQVVFARPVIQTARGERGKLYQMTKALREDTYQKKEHYDKQLTHFMNKARFQQHQSWQAEFDRLRSSHVAAGAPADAAYKNRLEDLRQKLKA